MYIYICIYVYTYMYIYIIADIYTCMFTYVYTHMYAYIYFCVYAQDVAYMRIFPACSLVFARTAVILSHLLMIQAPCSTLTRNSLFGTDLLS